MKYGAIYKDEAGVASGIEYSEYVPYGEEWEIVSWYASGRFTVPASYLVIQIQVPQNMTDEVTAVNGIIPFSYTNQVAYTTTFSNSGEPKIVIPPGSRIWIQYNAANAADMFNAGVVWKSRPIEFARDGEVMIQPVTTAIERRFGFA